MEVAPHIHRIEFAIGTKPMAMYLLAGDRLILVDSGLPDTPETIYLPAIEAIGRHPDDVRLLLITHADADHIGGNEAARRLFPGVALACHVLDQRWASDPAVIMTERYDGFADVGLRYKQETMDLLRSWMGSAEPMDLLVQGGDRIRLTGDDWLDIYHVPGHTPGHIALYSPAHRYAIIGDAVFGQSQLDTTGGKAAAPPYTDLLAYRQTIETLRALEIDLLLTCHYPVMRGPEISAFLDDSLRWSESAEEFVQALLDAGKPISLADAIDLADPVLGPFAAPGELRWPLRAHLDHATQEGRAIQETTDGVTTWHGVANSAFR